MMSGVVASSARRGNDSFTKSLLHFDGVDGATTITDVARGGASKTWTANGNAQLDDGVAPKFGSTAGLFDGTGDYFTTPDHTDFTLGSGDWTVDFWFNRAGGNGTRRLACGQSNSAGSAGSFACEMTAANVMRLSAYKSGSQTLVVSTTAITTSGWHHFAGVRFGNVLKLFIDGVQEGGDVAFTGSVDDNANAWSIGRQGEVTTLNWNGSIDEWRLSVGVARWTANFTPPVAPYR